jgi:hypothetical protein
VRNNIAGNLIAWGMIAVVSWWFEHANVLSGLWTAVLGLGLALVATGLIIRFRRVPETNKPIFPDIEFAMGGIGAEVTTTPPSMP